MENVLTPLPGDREVSVSCRGVHPNGGGWCGSLFGRSFRPREGHFLGLSRTLDDDGRFLTRTHREIPTNRRAPSCWTVWIIENAGEPLLDDHLHRGSNGLKKPRCATRSLDGATSVIRRLGCGRRLGCLDVKSPARKVRGVRAREWHGRHGKGAMPTGTVPHVPIIEG